MNGLINLKRNKMINNREERINFNKACAIFCGYKYYPHNYNGRIPSGIAGWQKEKAHLKLGGYLCRHDKDLSFSSDWNWIMEVVGKIESLKYLVAIQSNFCQIQEIGKKENNYQPYIFASEYGESKKEAVVQAIDCFFKFYNENLEMLK